MPTSDNIGINLVANTRNFEAGLRRANTRVDSLSRSFGRLTAAVAAGNIAAAAFTRGLAGLGSEVRRVADVTLQLDRITQRLTFATEGAQAGAAEFAFLADEADRLGLSLFATAESYSRFAAATRTAGLSAEESRLAFLGVAEAATVLRLDSSRLQFALLAVEQIASKGVVSMEELRRQLGEHIPGAVNIAARALGVTTAELNKLVESGQLLSTEFLPAFGAELRRTFEGDLPVAVDSAQAQLNRLQTELDKTREAFGSVLLPSVIEGVERFAGVLRDPQTQQAFAGFAESVSGIAAFTAQNVDQIPAAIASIVGGSVAGAAARTISQADVAAFYQRQLDERSRALSQQRLAPDTPEQRTAIAETNAQRRALASARAGALSAAGVFAAPITSLVVGTIIATEIISEGGVIEELREFFSRRGVLVEELSDLYDFIVTGGGIGTARGRLLTEESARFARGRFGGTQDLTPTTTGRFFQPVGPRAEPLRIPIDRAPPGPVIGRLPFTQTLADAEARLAFEEGRRALQADTLAAFDRRLDAFGRGDTSFISQTAALDARAGRAFRGLGASDRALTGAGEDTGALFTRDALASRAFDRFNEAVATGARLQERYVEAAAEVNQEIDLVAESLSNNLVAALREGENVFRAFGDSILETLFRLANQQFLQPALQGLLSAGAGALGFNLGGGAAGGTGPAIFHAGGRVGPGGQRIPLDTVPAYLQVGETVLPRGQSAAPPVQVINNATGFVEVEQDEGAAEAGLQRLIIRTVVQDGARGGDVRRLIEGIGR